MTDSKISPGNGGLLPRVPPAMPPAMAFMSQASAKDASSKQKDKEDDLSPEVSARVAAILGSGASTSKSDLVGSGLIRAKYSPVAVTGWVLGAAATFFGFLILLTGLSKSMEGAGSSSSSEFESSVKRAAASGQIMYGGGMIAAGWNTIMIASICHNTRKKEEGK